MSAFCVSKISDQQQSCSCRHEIASVQYLNNNIKICKCAFEGLISKLMGAHSKIDSSLPARRTIYYSKCRWSHIRSRKCALWREIDSGGSEGHSVWYFILLTWMFVLIAMLIGGIRTSQVKMGGLCL